MSVSRNDSTPGGDKEEIICELIERQSRASNIIVCNANESKMKTQAECDCEDSTAIGKILNNFNIVKTNLKMFLLGYMINKTRPIKVILNTQNDATFVLKNKQLIPILSIRIFCDQTKAQQEYFKAIKAADSN